jgi:glyceraldehyde 3-phosphate dehydrogenase
MKVIGVNGFGRIGRCFTRLILQDNEISLALINDPADTNTLMHLLKYDSAHGILQIDYKIDGDTVTFNNGKKIHFSHEKDPKKIQWSKYEVDIVIESSGFFLAKEASAGHIEAGAKRVIISAPAADENVPTIVLGVNNEILKNNYSIISNASCTTNNVAPLIKVLKKLVHIDYAYISTIHSYTSDQRLHDAPHRDLRRSRAAANSIVPTTTGAAKAITRIFPDLDGKITGGSVRVPVINCSMTELTLYTNTEISGKEINDAMKYASENDLNGVLGYTEDPIVSVDMMNSPFSCLFDAQLTTVLGNFVKVVGWYDNEAGYSNRLKDLVKLLN